MARLWRFFRFRIGCAALCIAAAGTLMGSPAQAGPRWGADYFPDVRLTTHEGKQVRFYDDLLKGKAVAVNVIYTRCTDECPLETARLAQVQKLLGERVGRTVMMYSISIDPEHDTPDVLKAYAQKFDAGPGWLFLTGRQEDIRLVTRKLGLSRNNDALNRDGHSSVLMLGNEPSGEWMRHSAIDNPRFLATAIGNFFKWEDAGAVLAYGQARTIDASREQFLFESRCASCHTIGGGDKIGPDLSGLGQRRSHAWLARYLQEPEQMLAEGDPVATQLFNKYQQVRMPNLGLAPEEIEGLLSFIAAMQARPAAGRQANTGSQTRKEGPQHNHQHEQ